jgi:hypothetical protein
VDIKRTGISTDVSGRPLILLSESPSDEWAHIFVDETYWSAAGMRKRPEIVNGSIGLPYMPPERVEQLLPKIDHAIDVANKTTWLKEQSEPEGSP